MAVELLVILISISFTTLITYFCVPTGHGYHYFAPFLLLIAGYIVGVAVMWCLLWLFGLPFKGDKKYEKPSKWASFWLSHSIGYINNHGGIKLEVTYNASLPKEKFLLVANHRSKFDPMILAQHYGKNKLAFISKPTNFKIPIGHRFMWGACYLPIDRYDKLKSLETMKRATDYIKNDATSIGVFPEGKRSEDNKLGPFHEGVFSIATSAKCPIVICSFMGTEKISKNFPKRRTKVKLQFLEVLYPSDYEGMIVKQISDHCYDVIKKSLTDYETE